MHPSHKQNESAVMDELIKSATHYPRLIGMFSWLVLLGVSLFLLVGAALVTRVPTDFTAAAIILFVLLLVRLLAGQWLRFFPLRLLIYMAIVFVVYLTNTYQPDYLSGADPITYIFFSVLVVAIALTMRFTSEEAFALTPMDFLIVLAVIVMTALANQGVLEFRITAITLKTIILFYGCELILNRMRHRWNVFTVAALGALLVIGVRGLMENVLWH